jgi:hypothetical protein
MSMLTGEIIAANSCSSTDVFCQRPEGGTGKPGRFSCLRCVRKLSRAWGYRKSGRCGIRDIREIRGKSRTAFPRIARIERIYNNFFCCFLTKPLPYPRHLWNPREKRYSLPTDCADQADLQRLFFAVPSESRCRIRDICEIRGKSRTAFPRIARIKRIYNNFFCCFLKKPLSYPRNLWNPWEKLYSPPTDRTDRADLQQLFFAVPSDSRCRIRDICEIRGKSGRAFEP